MIKESVLKKKTVKKTALTSHLIPADVARIEKVIEEEKVFHSAIDLAKDNGLKIPPKMISSIRELRKAIRSLEKLLTSSENQKYRSKKGRSKVDLEDD